MGCSCRTIKLASANIRYGTYVIVGWARPSANVLWEKAQDYQGRLGGEYGSGVPSWIGGYFLRLSESSSRIFVTRATTHELWPTTSSRRSVKSAKRGTTFGSGEVT